MLFFSMFVTRSPEVSASSPESRLPASLRRATTSQFANVRPFSLNLLAACPANPDSRTERSGSGNFLSLSPFPATLTDDLQLTENATTLSPFAATLTGRVKHNPFVCHSYGKHRGWGHIVQSRFFPLRNLTTQHSLLSTISFPIRTCAKRASNPRRIRTSKTRDLKPLRTLRLRAVLARGMRTYGKKPGGGA